MIDDKFGPVLANIEAHFRRRAEIEPGLADDAEMQRC